MHLEHQQNFPWWVRPQTSILTPVPANNTYLNMTSGISHVTWNSAVSPEATQFIAITRDSISNRNIM